MSKRPKTISFNPAPGISGDDPIGYTMHSSVYVPRHKRPTRAATHSGHMSVTCTNCRKTKAFTLEMVLGAQRLWKKLGWFLDSDHDPICGCCIRKMYNEKTKSFERPDGSVITTLVDYVRARSPNVRV